jgi:glycosyltransferase involved in cell wall biosynthesis
MKIVYPYPTYWPYVRRGVERCIHDLSNYLVRQGHEVDIITTKPGRGRISYDGLARVVYIPQFSHPLAYNYLRFIRLHAFGVSATRLIMKSDYDVAHLWAYSTILAAPLMSRYKNLPYLFHLMLRKHMWPGRVEEWFFGHLMRNAGRVAALTPGGAAEISAEHGVDVMTLSPPVDMDIFHPSEPADMSRPRVLFTGDLGDARKGGPLLLRAWDEIHRRCPDAVLVLAGPFGIVGYDTKFDVYTLERLDSIRSPAARAAVEIPGPGAVSELPSQYSRAAVTVLPSVEEAFGIVVTESLACGTPVVASAYDGPGELLTNPEVGVTVPLKTLADLMSERAAQQLADAVVNAIELAREPGTSDRCRQWAGQWSLDTIGPQVESVLTEVAETRGPVSGRRLAGVA